MANDTNTGAAAPQDERANLIDLLLDVGAVLSPLAEGGHPIARKEARRVLDRVRTVRASLPAQAVNRSNRVTPGGITISDDPLSAIECCIVDYDNESNVAVNNAILAGLRKAKTIIEGLPVQAVAPTHSDADMADQFTAGYKLGMAQKAEALALEIRQAAPVQDVAPTDEEIIAFNADDRWFSTSESKYGREVNPHTQYHTGEPGYIGFTRAVLARWGAASAVAKDVAPTVAQVDHTPPYADCSFRLCDLPGQCRGEGKCHHPSAAPQAGVQESVLIDGTAYEVPAAVAGELLRLHMAILQAPAAPQAVPDADQRPGFEWWDRICKLPTFSFLSPAGGGVVRVPDSCGSWIEKHAAQSIVDDAQTEINLLRERLERLTPTLAAQPAAQPADAQDAARYRYLRNEAWGCGKNKRGDVHVCQFGPGVMLSAVTELAEEALDAAIDAARTQEGAAS